MMRNATSELATRGPDLFDLTGKVAIVTGSTKGLGRAMAQGLAEAGATVVISSRDQDRCDQAAADITSATGRDTLAAAWHTGDWDGAPALVDKVTERFGRIDVLVNNAGINPPGQSASGVSQELWRKVFAVNVEGPLRMSQCVAPVMREGGGGSIVHIGTMAAYATVSMSVAYGASKAALKNMTVTMAREWAPWRIRVNFLSPGPFATEMTRGADAAKPGFMDMLAGTNPQGRVAEPGEIVGPVLYLASDASSFVTGDDITVSGGMRK